MKAQPNSSAKKWAMIFLVTAVLAPAFGQAASKCWNTHGIAAKNAKRSFSLRMVLLNHYQFRLNTLLGEQMTAAFQVVAEIARKTDELELANKNAPKQIGGIPLDFSQLPTVPAIKPETLQAFERAFGASAKDLDPATRSEFRAEALEMANKDPYLQWLGKNQSQSNQDMPSLVNPVDIIIKSMENPWPTALPPLLAYVSLYRSFDKRVAASEAALVEKALKLRRLEMALDEVVHDLRASGGQAGPLDARGLAPSLQETQKNLRDILDQQVRLYGARFPLRSFETASVLSRKDPIWYALGDLRQRDPSEKIPPGLVYSLNALKVRLGLPESFSNSELIRVMTILRQSNENPEGQSYQTFLLQAFGNPETNNAFVQILNLRTLIELIEADQNQTLYLEMLDKYEKRLFEAWDRRSM